MDSGLSNFKVSEVTYAFDRRGEGRIMGGVSARAIGYGRGIKSARTGSLPLALGIMGRGRNVDATGPRSGPGMVNCLLVSTPERGSLAGASGFKVRLSFGAPC